MKVNQNNIEIDVENRVREYFGEALNSIGINIFPAESVSGLQFWQIYVSYTDFKPERIVRYELEQMFERAEIVIVRLYSEEVSRRAIMDLLLQLDGSALDAICDEDFVHEVNAYLYDKTIAKVQSKCTTKVFFS